MRAKVRRILNKKLRKEKAAIESATRKRGLWASVGSSLGSLLAMAVTGGAAAPIVAGMLSGGLSYVGGTLGNFIARGTKGGKIKGGRFYQGERESLEGSIQEEVEAGAAKKGIETAMFKIGSKAIKGGSKFLSKAGKATSEIGSGGGFDFKNIFKAGESVQDYGKGLLGKLGKSLDFKSSFLGEKVGDIIHEGGWAGYALEKGLRPESGTRGVLSTLPGGADTGYATDTTYGRVRDMDSLPTGDALAKKIAEGEALSEAESTAYKSFKVDKMLAERGPIDSPPTFDEIMSGPSGGPGLSEYGPGEYKIGQSPIQYDLADQRSAEISAGLKNYQFSEHAERMRSDPGLVKHTPFTGGPGTDETAFSVEEYFKEQSPYIKDAEIRRGVQLDQDFTQIEPGSQILQSTDIPRLTSGERAAYDKINKMTEAGYPPTYTKGYHELSKEFGEGFINTSTGETVRPPTSPNVPIDQGFDEGFELGPEADVTMPEWGGFDEASWAESERKIRSMDLQRSIEARNRLGLKPNLMDSLGKPSLDAPFEAPSRGVGMDHPRLPSGMKHQAEMERIMGMSETAQREAALNLGDTDLVQTPYRTDIIMPGLSTEPTGMGKLEPWSEGNVGGQSFSPQYNFVSPTGGSTRGLQQSSRYQEMMGGSDWWKKRFKVGGR